MWRCSSPTRCLSIDAPALSRGCLLNGPGLEDRLSNVASGDYDAAHSSSFPTMIVMKNRLKAVALIAAIGIGLGVASPPCTLTIRSARNRRIRLGFGERTAPTASIPVVRLRHRHAAVLLYPDLWPRHRTRPRLPASAERLGVPKLVQDLTGQRRAQGGVFGAVAGLGLATVKTVLTYHIIVARRSTTHRAAQ